MKHIIRNEISSKLAHQMVGKAICLAEQMGVNVCVVVCDLRGHLVALSTDCYREPNLMSPALWR